MKLWPHPDDPPLSEGRTKIEIAGIALMLLAVAVIGGLLMGCQAFSPAKVSDPNGCYNLQDHDEVFFLLDDGDVISPIAFEQLSTYSLDQSGELTSITFTPAIRAIDTRSGLMVIASEEDSYTTDLVDRGITPTFHVPYNDAWLVSGRMDEEECVRRPSSVE